MKETNNFNFDATRETHVFYASTKEINEISIMEAIRACGDIEEYHWNNEKHLILINNGFVVATLHSIAQSKFTIISLFKRVADKNCV
ncbi:hypothetical protein IRT38_00730 (plasmid) [Acinetobacter sp. SK-43]|uniref:hypothetical protein n=1 Tax=Pseudomonadota TaxID=1224 RepID=UPI0012D09AFD|nr:MULTISPECIES: hypothetical protein [Pseudomonadota]MBF4453940.1 hypothetical protein [Acinetobacter sp. SK-43]MPS92871.1 hypothetical protein [Comamonas sp.]